jgi:hypothetical protein
VTLIRGLTEVDLFVSADGRVLVLGSKPDAQAIAAAALLAHQVPQPATRHRFDDEPPVPKRRPRR